MNNSNMGGIPPMAKAPKATKGEVIAILSNTTRATEVVQVANFESSMARHVCTGGTVINTLQMSVYPIALGDGRTINTRFFQCNRCGKLLLDKDSISVL